MKRIVTIGAAIVFATAVVLGQGGASPEVQLKAAIHKEQVEGDLQAAAEQFKKLTASPNPAVAAQAWVHLGQCYEKLGDAQARQAVSAYEKVVRDFPEQKDAVGQARLRLASLAKPAAGSMSGAGTIKRLLYERSGLNARGQATISADGRYLVAKGLTERDVLVRNLTTGDERRFVPAGLPEDMRIVNAVVSPDGRQIAYALSPLAGSKVPGGEVHIAAMDGTGARVLAKQAGSLTVVWWADDGTRLLGWSQAGEFAGNAPVDFVSITIAGGAITKIASALAWRNAGSAALSPDGRWFACTESRATTVDILLIETKTGARSWATDPAEKGDNYRPVWAPDGSGLLFVRGTDGTYSLWFQRLKEGRPDGQARMLRASIEDIGWPAHVTADGTLYSISQRTGPLDTTFKSYVAPLDPATGKIGQTPTVLAGLDYACGIDWSPDSTAIIYGAHVNQARGSCTLLGIRPMGGGRDRLLDPGMSEIRRPRWSPDGKSALVYGVKDGTAGIYSVELSAGTTKLLVTDPNPPKSYDRIMFPYWAPDGRGFYFMRYDNADYRLVHRDLETGQETQRFAGIFTPSQTTVAPDGSVSLLAQGKVIVVSADGASKRTVLAHTPSGLISGAGLDDGITSTCWTADGKGIWASQAIPTADEPRLRRLIRIPVDGRPPSDGGLQMAGLDNPRPSPDGKWLLFQASTVPADQVWAIERFLPARASGKKP